MKKKYCLTVELKIQKVIITDNPNNALIEFKSEITANTNNWFAKTKYLVSNNSSFCLQTSKEILNLILE